MGDGEDTLVIEAIEDSRNYTEKNTNISGVETVELLNSYRVIDINDDGIIQSRRDI